MQITKINRRLIIIEAGHLSETAVSGGELLMQEMAPYVQSDFRLEVVLPDFALRHWKIRKDINFHTIPSSVFHKKVHPFFIFIEYLWRSFWLYIFLSKISSPVIIYSSTNSFVDIFAPYIVYKRNKNILWCGRIHHVIQNPKVREGNFFINHCSFMLDQFSVYLLKSANLIFVLNKKLQNNLKEYNFPVQKVKVLGGGIDLLKIKKYKPLKKTPLYAGVYIGRIHRTKGVLDLPTIWRNVINKIPKARLAIIGELSDKKLVNELRKNIRFFGLESKIDILGFIAEEKKIRILASARVFLFTDHEAGWGLAVVESLACGVPVIGYDIGILGSVFKHGFLKIPKWNKLLFGNSIVSLILNNKKHHRLKQQALTEGQKWTWKKAAQKFKKLLNTNLKIP